MFKIQKDIIIYNYLKNEKRIHTSSNDKLVLKKLNNYKKKKERKIRYKNPKAYSNRERGLPKSMQSIKIQENSLETKKIVLKFHNVNQMLISK